MDTVDKVFIAILALIFIWIAIGATTAINMDSVCVGAGWDRARVSPFLTFLKDIDCEIVISCSLDDVLSDTCIFDYAD